MIIIEANCDTSEAELLARQQAASGRVKLRKITWKEGGKSFAFEEIALTDSAGFVNMFYRCHSCGHEGDELEARDDIQDTRTCPTCTIDSYVRVPTAHVSTSKLSVSIPDGVSKRFEKLRDKRKVAKEKRAARREKQVDANKLINKKKLAKEKA